MWEIPFYAFIVPVAVLLLSMVCTLKYRNLFLAPVLTFIGLNLITIVLPFIQNAGWEALFGWSVFYTGVSLLISLIGWAFKNRAGRLKEAR
ncbi:DUF2651 family protein [Bacillus sp. FJAT-42376]|uniref:DUF2651 family protein n=1 Tax=Bacillus sp. FJAT-42376 TaxID=2014076 RepID=UPI0013DE07D9|nr:DUF2651 family protein [Bacillus sp. FJAT-42376]